MKKFLLLSAVILMAALAPAATNTVASGNTALILPVIIPTYARVGITETNRVGAAQGALVRDGMLIKQLTVNGWEVCPTFRNSLIIQVIGGTGTAIVRDGRGNLVMLSSATYPAVTLTGNDASTDAYYITASGGSVTVFCSQR